MRTFTDNETKLAARLVTCTALIKLVISGADAAPDVIASDAGVHALLSEAEVLLADLVGSVRGRECVPRDTNRPHIRAP